MKRLIKRIIRKLIGYYMINHETSFEITITNDGQKYIVRMFTKEFYEERVIGSEMW